MQNVPDIVDTSSSDARIQLNLQIADTPSGPFLTSDWHDLIVFPYEIQIFGIMKTLNKQVVSKTNKSQYLLQNLTNKNNFIE